MKDILTAPFMVEMIRTTTNMYAHGWDERNGGNISLLLDETQVKEYLDTDKVLRPIPTGFSAPELDGKYFLVTGTGKYFKNVQYAPGVNLGLVRLTDGGKTAELLWGFSDGGTSPPAPCCRCPPRIRPAAPRRRPRAPRETRCPSSSASDRR